MMIYKLLKPEYIPIHHLVHYELRRKVRSVWKGQLQMTSLEADVTTNALEGAGAQHTEAQKLPTKMSHRQNLFAIRMKNDHAIIRLLVTHYEME